jgi:hypothetical protein
MQEQESIIYESKGGEETFYKATLETIIDNFIDDFFSDEYEIVRFNINFLENNNFQYQTKIDFMKLNRFIASALNTIKSNDPHIIDGLIVKFYKDIVYLNDFYKEFLIKSKDAENVYKHKFLKTVGSIEGVFVELTKDERKAGEKPRPPKNGELAEIEAFLKDTFSKHFDKASKYYSEELKRIINTKTYYFDKLLWSEAKRSIPIVEFFKKSKMSNSTEDEMSTKVFIERYLKSIDIAHAKDLEWHQYLQKVIKIMD